MPLLKTVLIILFLYSLISREWSPCKTFSMMAAILQQVSQKKLLRSIRIYKLKSPTRGFLIYTLFQRLVEIVSFFFWPRSQSMFFYSPYTGIPAQDCIATIYLTSLTCFFITIHSHQVDDLDAHGVKPRFALLPVPGVHTTPVRAHR